MLKFRKEIQIKKKIKQIHLDFEKSTNSFKSKKNRLPNYLLENIIVANFLITFQNYYYAIINNNNNIRNNKSRST